MYCRYYHALQLKLVEAAKGDADADGTDEGDGSDSSDAGRGDQECKNNAEDDKRCGADVDADEDGPSITSSPETSYEGYLVTIGASWFNVAWAKQVHGDDHGMAW